MSKNPDPNWMEHMNAKKGAPPKNAGPPPGQKTPPKKIPPKKSAAVPQAGAPATPGWQNTWDNAQKEANLAAVFNKFRP